MTEPYWISKTVVVDWPLVDLAGDPVVDADLAGTVTLPDGTTDAMTAAQIGDVARFTYDPAMAGLHAYRLESTGSIDSADEGTFYVKPSPETGPPPTLDPETDIGLVRLLITDVDEDNLLFSDAQIQAFITLEPTIKRAAATALEAIATSEALIGKVIRTQDLATDGTKVAAELRARAKDLRQQSDNDDADADGGFEIIDYVEPRWFDGELNSWRVP